MNLCRNTVLRLLYRSDSHIYFFLFLDSFWISSHFSLEPQKNRMFLQDYSEPAVNVVETDFEANSCQDVAEKALQHVGDGFFCDAYS